jgi:hypothetical protein
MAEDLRAALIDLVRAVSAEGIRVFLGGGYGLYLKQVHLMEKGERTFLPIEAWPKPRGTPDLDIFLPTEIVVDLPNMVRLRAILDKLDYKPDPDAKYMHFDKKIAQGSVRVELLTGPIDSELRDKVKINRPRVRPKGEVELHAYLTNEAVAIEVDPLSVPLSDGASVLIPNAFTFLLMKLHASRDRLDDEAKQLGQHHALDVYRVVAMLTDAEVELFRKLRREHKNNPAVDGAAKIVAAIFADTTGRGVIRMREHGLATAEMKVERMLELLHDLFTDGG